MLPTISPLPLTVNLVIYSYIFDQQLRLIGQKLPSFPFGKPLSRLFRMSGLSVLTSRSTPVLQPLHGIQPPDTNLDLITAIHDRCETWSTYSQNLIWSWVLGWKYSKVLGLFRCLWVSYLVWIHSGVVLVADG